VTILAASEMLLEKDRTETVQVDAGTNVKAVPVAYNH